MHLASPSNRKSVDHECEEENEDEDEEAADDVPLVVLPDDVLQSLPRTREPQKRRLWTTETNQNNC